MKYRVLSLPEQGLSRMRTTLENDSSKWPELWQAAYRLLEESVVPNQLRTWIQPLEWIEAKKEQNEMQVDLSAPNEFSADWVKDHYQKNIEEAISRVAGAPCKIRFIIRERKQKTPPSSLSPVRTKGASGGTEKISSRVKKSEVLKSGKKSPILTVQPPSEGDRFIDPRYTFDNFIVGASNQFARASAMAVAEKPGTHYNPLFIYSSPGLGKTHILYAIANHVRSRNPEARISYVSAESFVNELIDSIQRNRMAKFRRIYRESYDILLIDDIQFIAGKGKTEEEFFHTFNTLYGSKRQIVLTSDRPPKEIEGLEERIRTRFEWGLVADIQSPEIETRIAILKNKAEQDDIYLPDDVCVFLATHIKSNVRELEGILIRLQAQASLTGAEISLEMAKQELHASVPEESSHLTLETIQDTVSKHFHLKISDLKSTTRTKNFAMARQIAMYLIRKYTGMGFKEIGQFFGGKDHTTIMHACTKIEQALNTGSDMEVRENVEAIQNKL